MKIFELKSPYKERRVLHYHERGGAHISMGYVSLQHIQGSLYKDKGSFNKTYEYSCRLFSYFYEYDIGIEFCKLPKGIIEIDDIWRYSQLFNFDTADHIIANMDKCVHNGRYIHEIFMKLARVIAQDKLSIYEQSNKMYIQKNGEPIKLSPGRFII